MTKSLSRRALLSGFAVLVVLALVAFHPNETIGIIESVAGAIWGLASHAADSVADVKL